MDIASSGILSESGRERHSRQVSCQLIGSHGETACCIAACSQHCIIDGFWICGPERTSLVGMAQMIKDLQAEDCLMA